MTGLQLRTAHMTKLHLRPVRMLAVLATALVLAAGVADARPGGGSSSFGSRGSRTFQAPPSTTTSPRSTAPIERSMTPNRPSTTGTPGVQRPATAPGGFFSRGGGFLSGLMGGFLGAGLAGLLFGHGLFGGMGGFASILGLLLQIALVVFLVKLAMNFFRRRNEPAYQGAGGPVYREAENPGYGAAGYGRTDAAPATRSDALGLDKSDYDEFERVLTEIQTAYGREDLAALQRLATPEMVSYFAEELAQHASRGVVNRISDVKLLQGDLAEAWREGNVDYATVALRFSLIDAMADRATGRVLEGSLTEPTEATEVWTFMRTHGGRWLLSAIQQA